jgi:hypothetical protein
MFVTGQVTFCIKFTQNSISGYDDLSDSRLLPVHLMVALKV